MKCNAFQKQHQAISSTVHWSATQATGEWGTDDGIDIILCPYRASSLKISSSPPRTYSFFSFLDTVSDFSFLVAWDELVFFKK